MENIHAGALCELSGGAAYKNHGVLYLCPIKFSVVPSNIVAPCRGSPVVGCRKTGILSVSQPPTPVFFTPQLQIVY